MLIPSTLVVVDRVAIINFIVILYEPFGFLGFCREPCLAIPMPDKYKIFAGDSLSFPIFRAIKI